MMNVNAKIIKWSKVELSFLNNNVEFQKYTSSGERWGRSNKTQIYVTKNGDEIDSIFIGLRVDNSRDISKYILNSKVIFFKNKKAPYKNLSQFNFTYTENKSAQLFVGIYDIDNLTRNTEINENISSVKSAIIQLKKENKLPSYFLSSHHLVFKRDVYWVIYLKNPYIGDKSETFDISKLEPFKNKRFPEFKNFIDNWINLSISRHKNLTNTVKLKREVNIDFDKYKSDKDTAYYLTKFDEISLYDVANKTKEKRLEAENKKKQKLLAQKKAEEDKQKKLLAQKKAEEEKQKKLLAQKKVEEEEKQKKLIKQKEEQENKFKEKIAKLPEFKDPRKNLPKLDYYKLYLNSVRQFMKEHPDEFDIVTVAEYLALVKGILDDELNNEIENNIKEMILFTNQSEKFVSFDDLYIKKTLEVSLKRAPGEFAKLEKQISLIEAFLLNNLSSRFYDDAIKLTKEAKSVFLNPESLVQISNYSLKIENFLKKAKKLETSKNNVSRQIVILENYLKENLMINSSPKIINEIKLLRSILENEDYEKLIKKENSAENFLSKIPEYKKQKEEEEKRKLLAQKKAEEEKQKKLLAQKKAEEDKQKKLLAQKKAEEEKQKKLLAQKKAEEKAENEKKRKILAKKRAELNRIKGKKIVSNYATGKKKYNVTSETTFHFMEATHNLMSSLELLYRAYDENVQADKLKAQIAYNQESKYTQKQKLQSTRSIVDVSTVDIRSKIQDNSQELSAIGKEYYQAALPYAYQAYGHSFYLYHRVKNTIEGASQSSGLEGLIMNANEIVGLLSILKDIPQFARNMQSTTKLIFTGAKTKKVKDKGSHSKALKELEL